MRPSSIQKTSALDPDPAEASSVSVTRRQSERRKLSADAPQPRPLTAKRKSRSLADARSPSVRHSSSFHLSSSDSLDVTAIDNRPMWEHINFQLLLAFPLFIFSLCAVYKGIRSPHLGLFHLPPTQIVNGIFYTYFFLIDVLISHALTQLAATLGAVLLLSELGVQLSVYIDGIGVSRRLIRHFGRKRWTEAGLAVLIVWAAVGGRFVAVVLPFTVQVEVVRTLAGKYFHVDPNWGAEVPGVKVPDAGLPMNSDFYFWARFYTLSASQICMVRVTEDSSSSSPNGISWSLTTMREGSNAAHIDDVTQGSYRANLNAAAYVANTTCTPTTPHTLYNIYGNETVTDLMQCQLLDGGERIACHLHSSWLDPPVAGVADTMNTGPPAFDCVIAVRRGVVQAELSYHLASHGYFGVRAAAILKKILLDPVPYAYPIDLANIAQSIVNSAPAPEIVALGKWEWYYYNGVYIGSQTQTEIALSMIFQYMGAVGEARIGAPQKSWPIYGDIIGARGQLPPRAGWGIVLACVLCPFTVIICKLYTWRLHGGRKAVQILTIRGECLRAMSKRLQTTVWPRRDGTGDTMVYPDFSVRLGNDREGREGLCVGDVERVVGIEEVVVASELRSRRICTTLDRDTEA
ncbi:uncharacterized protein EV422DRAFT_281117 [Fimicolochytrium jonesii]|uniref:uncharacterized protein n=1 Tax=Fimicolochytrium jonesii TaxID=1396493 RepID=UPI0022FF1FAE|nr:uncharacterized protein EV422DRAFT_281117 [Fimicolochytrium jonesii]KAI8816622.1 hypothetical protein EV422DRAFT_281117 [Fimicolochytrium jonesii]